MEKGFSNRLLAVFLSLSALFWIPGLQSGAFAKDKAARTPRHVRGELIVKLKSDKSAFTAQALVTNSLTRALGAKSVRAVESFKTDSRMQIVRLARDADLDQAIQALNLSSDFEYAEPNYVMRIVDADAGDGIPNDADFTKLWGMQNTGLSDSGGQVGTKGSDINVVPAWKEGITGSRKILVAVIDTGVQWDHPDLKDNIYTNAGEAGPLAENGKDDDGNGFKDDVHGWNFNKNNRDTRDDHSHGSHCSGTIGGVGNNGEGVAGVNWQVSILPVKFLGGDGSGTLQGAVESINYARLMKVNIMSNSWGGGGFTQSLKDAIEKARDAGILFVAAAGNDKNDNDKNPSYPATYDVDNVVSVAATDNKDAIASFSNYGAKTVHVSAPGVRVLSTTMGGKYGTFSGTSMAAPHVAGIAALVLSANGGMDYQELKRRLIATSDRVPALRARSISRGRVNAYNALKNSMPPSQEPDESQWKTVEHAVESKHPYDSRSDQTFTINQPGAKFVRVIFEKVDTEASYDKVLIKNGAGDVVSEVSGTYTGLTSDYVTGETLTLQLKSDDNVNSYGFKISRIQVVH